MVAEASFRLWDRVKDRQLEYVRRRPETSALYRVVFNHHENLEQTWEERFQATYGCFRSEVREAFYKFLDCGPEPDRKTRVRQARICQGCACLGACFLARSTPAGH